MKPLVCEMCNSTDVVKQDNYFVCQHCGTKYSVEEAKKMMIEGTVDVSGSTVKIDTTDELTNLYQIARRAASDNNSDAAAKYYDMILVKDPESWEAYFYSVYFKNDNCTIAQIPSAAASIGNCIDSVLRLVKTNVKTKNSQIRAVQEISIRYTAIATLLYDTALNYYNSIDQSIKKSFTHEMCYRCNAALALMYIFGNSIESIFGDYEELRNIFIAAWKDGITKQKNIMIHYFGNAEKFQEIKDNIIRYSVKIQKYEPDYQIPISTGGCYVATCVYGSYDCPQVWTLRRYRDNSLAKTWYGRAFIHTYYAISPTLVKWFGETKWFKKIWKGTLDRMVANLQSEGVESTPYEDKEW